LVLSLVGLLLVIPDTALAANAYVVNRGSNSVSVIDTETEHVVDTIPVGDEPEEIALTSDGRYAYVTNNQAGTVSVIDTATNRVVGAPIRVSERPWELAVTPNGRFVYVVCYYAQEVAVIETRTNHVVDRIKVGFEPGGIAVTPDGRRAYLTELRGQDPPPVVSVINTETNQVEGPPIPVGTDPYRIAI